MILKEKHNARYEFPYCSYKEWLYNHLLPNPLGAEAVVSFSPAHAGLFLVDWRQCLKLMTENVAKLLKMEEIVDCACVATKGV